MSFLANGARQSTDFPHVKAVSLLLKIAQDENEDDQIRKMATITACEIICIIKGGPFSGYIPQAG
jgi:DsbC/DsbD-like thiol-disulfide interchange protein